MMPPLQSHWTAATQRMPKRFFRKLSLNRQHVHDQWYMRPFRHLLQDNRLFAIRRRTVVPAFAIGIFVGFMPWPGHIIMSALLAVAFRVNIPVAVVTSFFSNPLTMPPLYYSCYLVGNWVLGREELPFEFELSFKWITTQLNTIWEPLLLGCVLTGAFAALVGFVVLDIIWRRSIADYLARRRARRKTQ